MKLVGRAEELAAILAVALGPLERALIVVGEPGMGKSRLLEEAHATSPLQSVLVHTPAHESDTALSSLARVLAWVDIACSAALTEAAQSTRIGSMPPDSGLDAVRDFVARRRGERASQLLILIDDVDRLDIASQRLLAFLAEGLPGTGLRIVGSATRIDPGDPLASLPRCEITPLDDRDARPLAALAQAQGAAHADPGDAVLLADASCGVPAAIVDSVAVLGGRGLMIPPRPGMSQRALRTALVRGADAATVRLLELISLAPTTHLDAIAQEPDGPDLLDDLRAGGLLASRDGCVWIADPRLRSALFWSDPAQRRKNHRQLAALHRGIDDSLALWHSSQGDAAAQASTDLLDAAQRYIGAGDIRSAIEFAERARALALVRADAPRLAELATALLLHDEPDLADRYLTVAQLLAESTPAESTPADYTPIEPTLADRALRTSLETIRLAITLRRAAAVPDLDVDASVSSPDPYRDPDAATADIELLALAALCHAVRWEVDDARSCLERAAARAVFLPEVPEQHPVGSQAQLAPSATHELVETVDALIAAIDGDPFALELLPPVVGRGLAGLPPLVVLLRAAALLYLERYTDARRALAVLETMPTARAPLWVAASSQLRAATGIRSGHFQRAVDALAGWQSADDGATALVYRAWEQSLGPDRVLATSTFNRCVEKALAENNPAVASLALAAQGAAALADGAVDEAIAVLELADAIGVRFANPALLRHSVDLVEAYVLGGRMREARGRLEALEVAAAAHPSRWVQIAIARGRALVAPDDRSLALYLRALESFGPDDSPFDHGRTLVHFAFAQARLGFPRESEKSLAAARNAFASAGVPGWVARMQRGHGVAHPQQTNAIGVLTEEERLIVEKVREGYRNKEIAAALYISLRTVELRLTHIYRKVGARSRSHLAALLG